MPARKLRLQTMLLIIFVVAALVPTMFLAVWIQKSAFNQEMQSVRERHLLLARNLTGALSRYATDIEAVFDDISINIDDGQIDKRGHLLATIGISLLARVDSAGNIIDIYHGKTSQLPTIAISEMLNHKDWRAFGRFSITGVIPSREGVPSIYLLKKTGDDGWIIGNLSTEYIIKVQQAVTFGKQGHAAVVDHRGHILAHPSGEWQKEMKDISGLAPVKQMMAGQTGVIQFYSPAVKADMIAGYAAVPSTGWGVMIPQPLSELKEQAERVHLLALTVAAGGVFIAFMLAWWLSRSITRPIQATVAAASLLATNNPAGRALLPKGLKIAELETLCSSFSEMANQIDHARTKLEEKVQKRTMALRAEIKERKLLEERLRHMATHDVLTNLPNRHLFMDRLCKALQQGERGGHSTAVLFLDLDGFKAVNDQLGHIAGDHLLIEAARRLKALVRESDTVGRYGGDEFTVLLVNAGQRTNIAAVAEKTLVQLTEPFLLNGDKAEISVSIGIAVAIKVVQPEELILKADAAMYQAKANGKNGYQFSS